MIRKAIIVVLTLGAVGTGLLGVWSVRQPFLWDGSRYGERWLTVVITSGFLSAWYADRDIVLAAMDHPQLQELFDQELVLAIDSGTLSEHLREQRRQVRERRKTIVLGSLRFLEGRDFVFDCGAEPYRAVILKAPLWTLCTALGFYPAVAFIRGPLRRYRRRKRALCVRCGYNLTGLTEPRCPECGTEITRA